MSDTIYRGAASRVDGSVRTMRRAAASSRERVCGDMSAQLERRTPAGRKNPLSTFSAQLESGALRDTKEELTHVEKHRIELGLKFWGTLISHINGFACINAFSGLQRLGWFALSPLHASSTILLAFGMGRRIYYLHLLRRPCTSVFRYTAEQVGDKKKSTFFRPTELADSRGGLGLLQRRGCLILGSGQQSTRENAGRDPT